MYKQYAQDNGLEAEGEETLEDIINAQFKKYNDLKYEFTDIFFEMYDDLKVDGKDCELIFVKRDRDIRYSVIFKEAQFLAEYFDRVYDIIKDIPASERENPSAEIVAQLEAARRDQFQYAAENTNLPEDYKSAHGFSEINGINVAMYRADYYTRLVKYLSEAPFAGSYQFSYPRRFDNLSDGLFQKEDKWRVRFPDDLSNKEAARQEFVEQGVLTFTQVFRWAQNAPKLDLLDNKGDTLTQVFKMNTLALNDEVDCSQTTDSELCRSISAQELIGHYKELIDYMHFNDVDKAVFNKIGKVRKYGRSTYESLIKRKNNHQLFSYFDLIFKKIFSDGAVTRQEGLWFEGRLRNFTATEDDLRKAYFIFPYNKDEMYEIFDAEYRVWIDDYFTSINRFLLAAKEVASSVEPINYRYEDSRQFMLGDESSENKIDPVISNFQYGKFRTFSQDLNRNFKFYYRDEFRGHMQRVREIVEDEQP
ncbi:MAG: hypothetical protein HRT44_02760 [Bdellovibrionales bacterium]|nr:hypothetical protein [Bdellovibrionales bacterium]